jgi:hypothetical protein
MAAISGFGWVDGDGDLLHVSDLIEYDELNGVFLGGPVFWASQEEAKEDLENIDCPLEGRLVKLSLTWEEV